MKRKTHNRFYFPMLLAGIILTVIAFNSVNADENYDEKQFLLGVDGGFATTEKDVSNHAGLHLNFLLSYGANGFAPNYEENFADYYSEEERSGNAVSLYVAKESDVARLDDFYPTLTAPATLSEWKTQTVSCILGNIGADGSTYPHLIAHSMGEEFPEFYDKVYFDAVNYVTHEVGEQFSPNDLITCNYTPSCRPDLFLWVKRMDCLWFYVYPFTFSYDPEITPYEEYQDSLQIKCVDVYDNTVKHLRMFAQWNSLPNLHMKVIFQAKQEADAQKPPGKNRKPTEAEMLFQGWLAISRGAKGLAPFLYHNSVANGFVGLVDYYNDPNDEDHHNWYSSTIDAEAPGNEIYDGDAMYSWVSDLFGKVQNVDTRLKTDYQYTDGLYEVDMDTFQSIRGDMTTPFFFVQQIIVEPPSGKTTEEVYTELSLHHSPSGHNFFLLLNRSLHLTGAVGYQITLLNTLAGNPMVVNLVTGATYTPTLQGDEYGIHVMINPGDAGFFIVTDESEGGNQRELYLLGEWRDKLISPSFVMNHGSFGNSNGFAFCKWQWFKGKPSNVSGMSTWKHPCSGGEWEPGPNDFALAVNGDWGTFVDAMEAECMNYVKVIEHTEDPYGVLDDIREDPPLYGTESNIVTVQKPDDFGGCPDLYSYLRLDTMPPAFCFMEQNTILPHSRHVQAMAYDLLKLDLVNESCDHYYMNILENSTSTGYIDLTRLWAVDHPEGTEVVTSGNDSMYVYSEMQYPLSCVDDSSSDRLGDILWEDTASFGGPDGSYITVGFDDPGWTHTGLLVTTGMRGYPQPPDKDFYSVPQDSGASGWDSLGVVYGRLNPYSWVVDVSESEDFTFRILCHGADTAWLDRIALVKLESSGWSKQVAPLDSAVWWRQRDGNFEAVWVTPSVITAYGTNVQIRTGEQLSLRFDKLDTTSLVRDFVLETRGWYTPPQVGGQQSSGKPILFGLEVKQIDPLSNLARVSYSVPYEIRVKIAVYDITGRLVNTLIDKSVKAGYHSIEWQGLDDVGRKVSSGIYFIRMTTSAYDATKKLVILR